MSLASAVNLNDAYADVPGWITELPKRLKTSEICNETLRMSPLSFVLVPKGLITQEIRNEIMPTLPGAFSHIPYHFKTQEMCKKAVEEYSPSFGFVSDHLKSQEMCDKAFEKDPYSLIHLPNRFVRQVNLWYDDNYNDYDYDVIEWYESYQKCKPQKAKIKEKLLPIAWYPNHVMGWCMSEDEKRRWK